MRLPCRRWPVSLHGMTFAYSPQTAMKSLPESVVLLSITVATLACSPRDGEASLIGEKNNEAKLSSRDRDLAEAYLESVARHYWDPRVREMRWQGKTNLDSLQLPISESDVPHFRDEMIAVVKAIKENIIDAKSPAEYFTFKDPPELTSDISKTVLRNYLLNVLDQVANDKNDHLYRGPTISYGLTYVQWWVLVYITIRLMGDRLEG